MVTELGVGVHVGTKLEVREGVSVWVDLLFILRLGVRVGLWVRLQLEVGLEVGLGLLVWWGKYSQNFHQLTVISHFKERVFPNLDRSDSLMLKKSKSDV